MLHQAITPELWEQGWRVATIHAFTCPRCDCTVGYDSDHGGPVRSLWHKIVKTEPNQHDSEAVWLYGCPDCGHLLCAQQMCAYYQNVEHDVYQGEIRTEDEE